MSEPRKPDYFKAIATNYRQYEFRSRLEAKWAAFFDLCGWSWSYEPVDHNGWIPDFAIGYRPTLVEVKPFFREHEWLEAVEKIRQSQCQEPVILLGADPSWIAVENDEMHNGGPMIGWLLDSPLRDESGKESRFMEALHFGLTEGNDKLGLCPMEGAWNNWIWSAPPVSHANKWSRVSLYGQDIETHLVSKWANACNIAKWIPNAQLIENPAVA